MPGSLTVRGMKFYREWSEVTDPRIYPPVASERVPRAINTRDYDKSQWKANYVVAAADPVTRPALMVSSECYCKLHYLRLLFRGLYGKSTWEYI